jgi:hypothetical protein
MERRASPQPRVGLGPNHFPLSSPGKPWTITIWFHRRSSSPPPDYAHDFAAARHSSPVFWTTPLSSDFPCTSVISLATRSTFIPTSRAAYSR